MHCVSNIKTKQAAMPGQLKAEFALKCRTPSRDKVVTGLGVALAGGAAWILARRAADPFACQRAALRSDHG